MDSKEIRRLRRGISTQEVAGRSTDPAFYSALKILPNPDPLLRAMGRADEAYQAIMSDAHVIGEVRSIRSGMLSYKQRLVPHKDADESEKQHKAIELCKRVLDRQPAPGMQWQDTIWNMATAVLRGFKVHEIVWEYDDQYLLPQKLLDRPNRRFKFDQENNLRLLTKHHPTDGEETEPYKWLVTRHMPSIENPYGEALLSACFWPYTFKTGGFKFLYQYCERVGIPWPVGRYPKGTPEPQQQELLDALLELLASGVAAIPEGDSIELLTVNHSGELAQEQMVHLCNREMSKALTSQTLATEMRNVGSNAASKTHSEREQSVHQSDRAMVEATLNELMAMVVKFNLGEDVLPPTVELFKKKKADKERVEQWKTAAEIGRPSRKAFHEETGIPMAEDDDDVLHAPGGKTPAAESASEFNRSKLPSNFTTEEVETLTTAAVSQASQVIEDDLLVPFENILAQYEADGKTLQDVLNDLPNIFTELDESGLESISSQVLQYALAEGIVNA